MTEKYSLYVKWSAVVSYLLDLCGKFPKNVRFNLSNRITNLSLDVMELIVEAIYTKQRNAPLHKANLAVEKIRILIQLSTKKKYISLKQYRFITLEINECGKMIGGWMKKE